MRSWVIVVLVVLLGPRLLKLWNRRQRQVNLQRIPLTWGVYSAVDAEAVPPGTRAGFERAIAELQTLGFVMRGYVQTPELLPEMPRTWAVLWHPVERAFATLCFRVVVRPIGLAVDFITLLEGERWVWTELGRRYQFIADCRSGRLVDTLVGGVAERWEIHRQAVAEEGQRAREAGLAELCAFQSARDAEEIGIAMAHDEAVATDDPRRFYLTARGARAVGRRQDEGMARVTAAKVGDSGYADVPAEELERHYRMASRVQEVVARPRSWWILALSAVAFAASMVLYMGRWGGWSWIAMLVPVVLFHELGHWAAMRLLGHRDAWIAFIPFIGAATISTKRFDKLWHEIVVLFAGPLPGIFLAMVLVVVSGVTGFHRSPLFRLSGLLVALNVFNLLPVHPLDGGRILHALVTAGRPRASLALKGVAAAAFLVAAIALRDASMGLLAAFTGFVFWQEIKRTRIETEVRRMPGFAESTTPEARRRFIYAKLAGRPEGEPTRWLTNVRLLEVPLSHVKPGRWWAAVAGLGYVGCFLLVGVAVARFRPGRDEAMRCPGRDKALALSCASPTLASASWPSFPAPARGRRRWRSEPEWLELSKAAFVWCDLSDAAATRELSDQLTEAAHNSVRYCTAYPWEKLDDGAAEQAHLQARATLGKLRRATDHADEDGPAGPVDALIARERGRPGFDEEVARIYRNGLKNDFEELPADDKRVLISRLGRSPTSSCSHLLMSNVSPADPGPEATPGARPPHATRGPSGAAPPNTVRFAVRLSDLDDFAPLGRHLCSLGCRIAVLPIPPDDVRTEYCF
jgi:Zn-dependent protease